MNAKNRYLKLIENPPKAKKGSGKKNLLPNLINKREKREAFLQKFVKATTAAIEEGLDQDGIVRIHNFGTFQLQWAKERTGTNPSTGEKIAIAGRNRIVFRPVQKLSERVNKVFARLKPEMVANGESHQNIDPTVPEIEETIKFDIFDDTEIAIPTPFEKKIDPVITQPNPPIPASPPITIGYTEQNPFAEQENEVLIEEEIVVTEDEPWKEEQTTSYHDSYNGSSIDFQEDDYDAAPTVLKPLESAPEYQPYDNYNNLNNSEKDKRFNRYYWYSGILSLFILFLLLIENTPLNKEKNVEQDVIAQTKIEQTNIDNSDLTPSQAPDENTMRSKTEERRDVGFAGGRHVVSVGDNMWNIADLYYLDPYLWPNIYRINTLLVENPDLLIPNLDLSVPVLYGTATDLTDQDRRNIAEGYFLVFQYYKENQQHLAPFALWAAAKYDAEILEIYSEQITESDIAFLAFHKAGALATR